MRRWFWRRRRVIPQIQRNPPNFLCYLQKPDHLPISTSLPVSLMPKLSNISLVFFLSVKVRFLNPGLLESISFSFVGFLFSFFCLFFSFWSWAPCDFSKMEQRVGKEKQPSRFPAGMWVTAVFPWLAFHCSRDPCRLPLWVSVPECLFIRCLEK